MAPPAQWRSVFERSKKPALRGGFFICAGCSLLGWTLVSCFIPGMAGAAGLVHFLELLCETWRVVGRGQLSQPGCRGRIKGRSPIEVGAVFPDHRERLRTRGRLTHASPGRKHSRKSLGPFCKRGRRIALTLGLPPRFHGIAHRPERDRGHIQAGLPRGDGIRTRYPERILLR